MKVCFFLGSLNRGGIESLALDVCRNIHLYKLNLVMIHRNGGELEEDFKDTGISISKIEKKSIIDIGYFLRLRKYFIANSIDIIHTHQPIDAIYTYFSCLGLNKKIVATHHGFVPGNTAKNLLKFIIPKLDGNIFVSESCLEMYKNFLEKKEFKNSLVVHNGIDLKRLVPKYSNIRQELNLNDSVILLGMVGNFYINARDQLTICKALPSILSKIKNSHFIFVGGKSLTEPEYFDNCHKFCLENNILDRVHFIGVRSDVPSLLNEFDYFVYSSNYETFGISVVEAMMAGLPCVINDIAPMLELSENGKYAAIYSTKNAEQLSEKIVELAENENWRARLGKLAKEYANNSYTIEAHLLKLFNFYSSLV